MTFGRLAMIGLSGERDQSVENLATLIGSGMNVSRALDALARDARSKRIRALAENIRDAVKNGSPLWRALEETGCFPSHVISLVRVGESSGRLSQNLQLLAKQSARDREFQSKVRSAMAYPLFVFSVTLIVGIGVAWFILPKLATVFAQIRIELPPVTKALLAFGAWLGVYGGIVLPVIAVGLLLLYAIGVAVPWMRATFQWIILHLPGFRDLLREIELARLGYAMGTLLQAGVPIDDALDSAGNASSVYAYRGLLHRWRDGVRSGKSFQEMATQDHRARRLIPATVEEMLLAAELSGKLPETFTAIAEQSDQRVDATTKNLSVIIEPVLLVLVWLGVVAVALAVILPVYRLVGGLRDQIDVPSETHSVERVASESDSRTRSAELGTPDAPSFLLPASDSFLPSRRVLILDTGIGYLKVRVEPSVKATVIGRAPVGSRYDVLDGDRAGWFHIQLTTSTTGWVSAQYATTTER